MRSDHHQLAKLVARNNRLGQERDALLAAHRQDQRTKNDLRRERDILFQRIGKLEWRLHHRSLWSELWQWITGKEAQDAS